MSNLIPSQNKGFARGEDTIKESIDEMVAMWKGSKLVGKAMSWAVGIIAAIGAAWAAAKKSTL